MRISDIKIGHMYYIDYDPVRYCEFNGKHLSVVLKRNNDRNTCIVMPMTSSPNGDGVNKTKIGCIANLPQSIRKNEKVKSAETIRRYAEDVMREVEPRERAKSKNWEVDI
jgi:mRNA-degrading endonuclease toxin of MazEF toxin-antitoxin module